MQLLGVQQSVADHTLVLGAGPWEFIHLSTGSLSPSTHSPTLKFRLLLMHRKTHLGGG